MPEGSPHVKLYRYLIRPLFEKPLPILGKYWCGVYIGKDYHVKHGPCIPSYAGVHGVIVADTLIDRSPYLRWPAWLPI